VTAFWTSAPVPPEAHGTFTDPLFNGDASLSMTTAHSAANGDTLFLNCHQLFSDSTTYKGTLTAIRVSSIE
jgi:hypothetical protein